jgi:DNA-binding LytR/AlgR family response regulator
MIKLLTNQQVEPALRKVEEVKRDGFSTAKAQQAGNPDKYLFVKVNYSTVKVCFNEIRYIEGLKDYIKIYINERSLITKSTIKHMESKLPAENFSRVHKSYIISIDKIDKIEYNHIFIGQKKIPIGMQFKDSFYEKIDHFRL